MLSVRLLWSAWLAVLATLAPIAKTHAHPPAPAPNPLAPGRSAYVGESPFGLSIEYPLLQRAMGSGSCPGEALVAKLRELGSPTLRVGGDSQDLAGPGPGYHYDIPPSFWGQLGCLARETGAQVVVGLNFATNALAGQQATIAAARQAIPEAQLLFSLGNEPDLYQLSHIIPNDPGFVVPAFRSRSWSAGAFAGEWSRRRAQLGAIPVEGPDLAGTSWRAKVERTLRADPPSQVDAHGYPTVAPCAKYGSLATPARLLSPRASVGMAEKLSWLARLAHSIGRPAVISETNSASCGGRRGVSDRPVAGVWAVRYVIAALLAGFQQVRFHSAGTWYDPLVFQADGSVAVRPLGQALLFLHRGLPVGSRIVSISHDPRVLAVSVSPTVGQSGGGHSLAILSSFADGPLRFSVPVAGTAKRVGTETLGARYPGEAAGSATVRGHRARLLLRPGTVVAVETA